MCKKSKQLQKIIEQLKIFLWFLILYSMSPGKYAKY